MCLLSSRDDLRKTPDRLDNFISGKYFLNATRLLLTSLKTLENEQYANIGALVDLRHHLQSLRAVCTHIPCNVLVIKYLITYLWHYIKSIHETLLEELNR